MTQGPSLPSVFVSAVSGELKGARQLVANCLRVFHNVEVTHQDQFGTESGDLLVKLKTAIDGSVGILQLMGEAYGAAPPNGIPELGGEISFTQYEFLYALERKKKEPTLGTWLIEVTGSCTRNVNAPEFVTGEGPGARDEDARLLKAYRTRLSSTAAGGPLAARASDDDGLKLLVAEHNRRRQLQRDYFARHHAHLRYPARNDDELVKLIEDLQGLPQVEPPARLNIGLASALGENFLGRAPLMFEVLAQLLRPSSKRGERIVLQGLGGSGKTTLASEIGHAYNKIGHDVFMFKPTPGRDLDEAISTLVSKDKFDVSDAAGVRKWLASNPTWLMIVDGVDDLETAKKVQGFCGEFPGGSFLITSYLKGYWDRRRKYFTTRHVEELRTADAQRLLRLALASSRPPDPEPDMMALATLLGGLPLAIEHAIGYLRTRRELVKDYVARLETANLLPEAEFHELEEPLRPIAATWRTSLQHVRPSSRTFLRLLSFLTDDPVPTGLVASPEVAAVFARACAADPLEQGGGAPPLPDASDTDGWQDEIWNAIDELRGYCLIRGHDEADPTHIRAHRLVLVMTQARLRAVAADVQPSAFGFQGALASAEQASSIDVHGRFLGHAIRFVTDYIAREKEGRKQIFPHLFHLAKLYLERQTDTTSPRAPLTLAPDELILLGEIFSLMGEGHEEEAAEHFARAAAAPEATTFERARASQGAGWASFQANRHADALEHYIRADEAIEGEPEDERTDAVRYEIHSGRGWVNRFVGNVGVAIPQLERALILANRSGEAGRVADAHINLGGAYDYAGDYDAARRRYNEGIELADASGDDSYRGVARYMAGWFLIRQGPFEEGMALSSEALTIGEEFEFGDVRNEAAWILAIGHARAGRIEKALELADRSAQRPGGFVAAWVLMIRGIMRFRAGRSDAEEDFNKAIEQCTTDITQYENVDPLDTRAFSHAGLAILGHGEHEALAVRDYRRGRELAPAAGIIDIGRTVFSCFGSAPTVARLADRLFGNG